MSRLRCLVPVGLAFLAQRVPVGRAGGRIGPRLLRWPPACCCCWFDFLWLLLLLQHAGPCACTMKGL
eukprot:COSAG01_NODE_40468_length_463_cov_0.997253_1_plen_66_part_01